MADEQEIRRRYERYVEEFRQGEADPGPALAGLDEESRRILGLKIEAFLETGPVPDPEMMSPDDPRVVEAAAALMPRLDGRAGGLSLLLARRRQKLELSQAGMVKALGQELGASEPEREKIDAYYHDLEWGTLPAAGLADQVVEAMARILRTTSDSLREAGRTLGPARASSTGPVYARMVEEDGAIHDIASAPSSVSPSREATPPDRIDRLFTGG